MIIGLDVGGTHTDVVLLGQEGLVRQIKVPTNPTDLFATVLTGLEKITEGIDPARISRAVLVHHPGHQPHRAGSDPRSGDDRIRRARNGSRSCFEPARIITPWPEPSIIGGGRSRPSMRSRCLRWPMA